MPPLIIILVLLVGLPLFELWLLIEVGSEIGALTTIGLSLLTALAGGLLVRAQGIAVVFRMQNSLASGQPPAMELFEGALLLIAGISLMFPGFLTDALGFLLLLPGLRRTLIRGYLTRLQAHVKAAGPASGNRRASGRGELLEGEFTRHPDE